MQDWKFSQKRYTTSEKFKSAHWADFFLPQNTLFVLFLSSKEIQHIVYAQKNEKGDLKNGYWSIRKD